MGNIQETLWILASGSPRRRDLLRQIGIQPEICPSQIEEKTDLGSPEKVVAELSVQKAEAVAENAPEQVIVVGADTVVSIDGRILGKPKSHEEAYKMLCLLQGRTHEVFTGVTLILKEPGKRRRRTFVEKTEVALYAMSEAELRAYAESEEPMDKAGAYGIQGNFARYVSGITGDYGNVAGLPIGRVYQEWKALMAQEEEIYD